MFKSSNKNIVAAILFIVLIFAIGFYNLQSSELPKEVDKVLKRNGVKKYSITAKNPENEFNNVLLNDKFTSFDILDENQNRYFIAYDNDINSIILLDQDNKIIEGLLDNIMMLEEDFNKFF